MKKMNVGGDALLGLYAEMVLDEAIKKYKLKNLYSQIDRALEEHDDASFYRLTKELRSLMS